MKKKRLIIISIIILNIIGLVIILILNDKKKEEELSQYMIKVKTTDITIDEIYQKLDIKIDNLYELVKLESGEIETSKFTTVIADFIKKDFVKTYNDTKDMQNNEISTYYYNNKEDIETTYGITEEETFENLVNNLKILEKEPKYESICIVENSCRVDGDYIYAKMQAKYENNNTIEFNVRFVNKKNINTTYVSICE